MRRTAITMVSLALTAAPIAATPAVAGEISAPTSGRPDVIAGKLLSPLSLDIARRGRVWFSQNFAGQLMTVRPGHRAVVKYQAGPGTEVGAVSYRRGAVTFATTSPNGRTMLHKLRRNGRVATVANLSRFERRRNPDQTSTYGFQGLPEECAEGLPPFLQSYTGIVESHPYATAQRRRTAFVADAAGNTILKVTRGKVRTVAVLPPQLVTVTAEAAEANGLPPCVAGHDFAFEPVPTDVEVHDGMLYVSTLPGGPEDPSLGNRGAVHRIDPSTGAVETIATGLLSATGLAVARNGSIYVAELFGGRISWIPSGGGAPQPWRRVSLPGAVEFKGGRVWATRRVLSGTSGEPGDRPRGQVVRFPR